MGELTERGKVEGRMVEEAASAIANVRTREEYQRDVRQYLDYCQRIDAPLAEGLEGWKVELRSSGMSVASINRKLSGVKSALRRAADSQGPEFRREMEAALSSVRGIRQSKGAIRAERMLSPLEVEKMRSVMSDRGRGFVDFLYATGCRVSEALGVRLSDCQVNGAVTIEVTGKGSRARKVRISRALYEGLRATFDGKNWLFETGKGKQYPRSYVSAMIERASKRTIGRMISAHALRHSFAIAMIAKTGKVQGVSSYLGYSDPSTTLRFYTHESLSDADLGVHTGCEEKTP